jgi:hypothetical protein
MGAIRLRALPALVRLGLSGVVLTLLLGVWASLTHMRDHHQTRDESKGLTLDDLVGAYHGLDRPSRLVVALEAGHPDDLPEAERGLLLAWLSGEKVSEQYDALELGDSSPAEVLDRSCVQCHARQATEGGDIGASVPLEYWDDVAKVAFSRSVEATPAEIQVMSLHTHALSLAVVTLATLALLLGTRAPRGLQGVLAALAGVGLIVDLASQLAARSSELWVWGIVAGGAAWAIATVVSCLAVLADLWLPESPRSSP